MKYSSIYPKTRKEDPKSVVSPGTKLLIRAGFMEQVSSGIWIMSLLGLLVRRQVENIIREEMNNTGANEVELPILQPKELWEETGRWDKYIEANIAFKLKDRKDLEYFLAPTAEEVVTNFARKNLRSYKDLPANIWQMNTKFRDEMRPRQGLIRGREFIMKDAYSFDRTEEEMANSYNIMNDAYNKIFNRCGMNFIKVEADSGSIGGNNSAEFMALTDIGEDTLLHCPKCSYGGNQEKASAYFPPYSDENLNPLNEMSTPDIKTVEDLYKFTGVEPEKMIKTVVLEVDGKPVIVSLRGDLEISETKIMNLLKASNMRAASPEMVQNVTNAPVGFAGPVGLYKNTEHTYLFDISAKGLKNFLCGGNKKDIHYTEVNFGRDFQEPEQFYDLSEAVAGLTCSNCKEGILETLQGIETGHIFQLGQVYSKPMNAKFINKEGREEHFWMGCYGIGVSRIVQTVAEQSYDDKGIVWPINIAPFQVLVIPVNSKVHLNDGEKIYKDLEASGLRVLFDNTDARAGEKFINAELIGIPVQVVVGRAWEENQKVEVRWRNTKNYDASKFSVSKPNALPSCEMTIDELNTFLKAVFGQ